MNDHPLRYERGSLHLESVELDRVAAACGTPTYVYSSSAIAQAYGAFEQALAPLNARVCYAVKANHNIALLALLARLGAHFDIVSGGELQRVLRAGGAAGKIVFSGVGKTEAELAAALDAGIGCFNVESTAEIALLERLCAARRQRAPIALRVNPDVDARTHPYISTGLKENKFGIALDSALPILLMIARSPHLELRGLACHIGSQITELAPLIAAYRSVLALADRLAANGVALEHVDLGGGLGVRYRDETPIDLPTWGASVKRLLGERMLSIHVEPGRRIVAAAGALLTRIVHLKEQNDLRFAVVDAAMNDLLRPALYDAWHEILPVRQMAGDGRLTEVVGPVCESADVLGRARLLNVGEGALLAIADAGAYGFVMSSNYNARPRAAEVMIDGDRFEIVRRRETLDDQLALERIWPAR